MYALPKPDGKVNIIEQDDGKYTIKYKTILNDNGVERVGIVQIPNLKFMDDSHVTEECVNILNFQYDFQIDKNKNQILFISGFKYDKVY